MISKSAATEIITDYCLLLEKQTEGFTRDQLLETVQFLYRNTKNVHLHYLLYGSPRINQVQYLWQLWQADSLRRWFRDPH